MKKEINTTYSSKSEIKPLTLKILNEAIDKLKSSELRIESIKFSDCDRFIDILKNITPKKLKKQISAIDLLFGIPILERSYVPKNEVWFMDKDGLIIKRFKFIAPKE